APGSARLSEVGSGRLAPLACRNQDFCTEPGFNRIGMVRGAEIGCKRRSSPHGSFRLETFADQIFLFSEYCAIVPPFQRKRGTIHGTDSNTRAAAQHSGQGRAEEAD